MFGREREACVREAVISCESCWDERPARFGTRGARLLREMHPWGLCVVGDWWIRQGLSAVMRVYSNNRRHEKNILIVVCRPSTAAGGNDTAVGVLRLCYSCVDKISCWSFHPLCSQSSPEGDRYPCIRTEHSRGQTLERSCDRKRGRLPWRV